MDGSLTHTAIYLLLTLCNQEVSRACTGPFKSILQNYSLHLVLPRTHRRSTSTERHLKTFPLVMVSSAMCLSFVSSAVNILRKMPLTMWMMKHPDFPLPLLARKLQKQLFRLDLFLVSH